MAEDPTREEPTPRRFGSLREWGLRAGLVLGSTLLTLGGAELGIRLGSCAPQLQVIEIQKGVFKSTDNPDLPYIPNPGRGGFSSYGLRDAERPIAHPPGLTRIVVLGDSVVFAGMVSREEMFTARIAVHLELAGIPRDRLEVWNLAVPGYATVNEVEYLKLKGLALEPDVVLVGYCLNDSKVHSSELHELMARPGYAEHRRLATELQRNALLRSHLVRLVATRLEADAGEKKPEPHVANFTEVDRGFAELARLAEERHFVAAVVVFPFIEPFNAYRHNREHRLVKEAAARHNLPLLDMLPAFRQQFGDEVDPLRVHPKDYIHFAAPGQEAAAMATARFLLERGLVAKP